MKKLTSQDIRTLIREEFDRSLSEYDKRRDKRVGPHRELKYAQSQMAGGPTDTRSRKGRQRQFHKAARQHAKGDIKKGYQEWESEGIETMEIPELIPDEDMEWWDRIIKGDDANLHGTRDDGVRAYLGDLAWRLIYGEVILDLDSERHNRKVDRLAKLSKTFADTLSSAGLQLTADLAGTGQWEYPEGYWEEEEED